MGHILHKVRKGVIYSSLNLKGIRRGRILHEGLHKGPEWSENDCYLTGHHLSQESTTSLRGCNAESALFCRALTLEGLNFYILFMKISNFLGGKLGPNVGPKCTLKHFKF